MAGFFGVPEYQEDASLEIMIEDPGFNNTFAPYYRCNNSNVERIGYLGSQIASNWSDVRRRGLAVADAADLLPEHGQAYQLARQGRPVLQAERHQSGVRRRSY